MPLTEKQNRASGRTRDREATRMRLINAVGHILAERGFSHLGVNAVARAAGVDKVLIYRYFDGMPGLIKAFGQEGDFWPGTEELAGGDIEAFQALPLEERFVALGENFLKGILKRPLTQEVMAWEMVERNDLTEELEVIRERRMTRFAERFLHADGVTVDMAAVAAVVGAGISYLVCRARSVRWYNGVDLESDAGWQRIRAAIRQIAIGVMAIA